MGDSELLFRLRWFLAGSMTALLIARQLDITVRPSPASTAEAATAPSTPPTVTPRALRRTNTVREAPPSPAVQPAPAAIEPAAAETPTQRPARTTRSAPAATAPSPADAPDAGVAVAETPSAGGAALALLDRADAALRRLGRAPRDAEARARAERLLESVARALPAAQQEAAHYCLTQAGFEGNEASMVNLLQGCAQKLREQLR